MKVGVLALQGDVPEHWRALRGVVPEGDRILVRGPADLARTDALFLPGGPFPGVFIRSRRAGGRR